VRALIHTAAENAYQPLLLQAVHQRNEAQKQVLFAKIVARFGRIFPG